MTTPSKDCTKASTGLTPLLDLSAGSYAGYTGGLYGAGSNARPPALDAAVLAAGAGIAPLANGKIDVVFVGDDLGNAMATGAARVPAWASTLRPEVRTLNCSNPAQHLESWSGTNGSAPGDGVWTNGVVAKLAAQVPSRSAADVQVALFAAMPSLMPYLTQADPATRIAYVTLRMKKVFQKAKQYLPNVKLLVLFGGHEYLGYYSSEPLSYDVDFGVQQALLQQDASMALSCWGNSSWADGMVPRSDGLTWRCEDVGPGGHLVDGVGNVRLVNMVVLPWLQSEPAMAGLRR